MKSSWNDVETKQSNHRKGAHRVRNWWMISIVAILGLPAPCWSQFKEPVLTEFTSGGAFEWGPTFSSDMLEVYWVEDQVSGDGPLWDVWESRRESIDAPWEDAELLDSINTDKIESSPHLSNNGLTLTFASNGREGGFGGLDLWQTTRESRNDPWQEPVNMGPTINTRRNEGNATFSIDGLELIFNSGCVGPCSPSRLRRSIRETLADDWTTPEEMTSNGRGDEIGSAAHPSLSPDGLSLYFNYPGSFGDWDVFVSKRPSLDAPFGERENLGPPVSTSARDGGVRIAPDGSLYNGRGAGRGIWRAEVYVPLAITLRGGGDTYIQDFDTALGIDGQVTDQPLPNGWAGTSRGMKEVVTASFPAGLSLGSGTRLYNAGGDQDVDRALAISIGRNTTEGFLQLSADVSESNATGFQLVFDVEAWDAGRVTTLGEAAFDVTVDLNSGDGFAPLVDLGRVTTGAGLFPAAGEYVDGNGPANRVSFDSGQVKAQIPADSQLRVRWTAASDAAIENWVFGLDNVSFRLFGEEALTQLLAGDADQDLDFDQLDLVQVQVANKYLTGEVATWGEGDWDGAPGGSPGNPPAGDGQFNQFDIIAAQQGAAYLTGPYAAIESGGQSGDGQTSVVYSPATGELSVDAPLGVELTSINIDSASGIFNGDAAQNLGGSFDHDADKATSSKPRSAAALARSALATWLRPGCRNSSSPTI